MAFFRRYSFKVSCAIHDSFALRPCLGHLLFISFVLQVAAVYSYIFLSIFFLFLSWKYLPLCRTILLWEEETLPFWSQSKEWILSSSWRWSVSCICTHMLILYSYLRLLFLHCTVTVFTAVLTFPAAQWVCLCPYYANLISREGFTAIDHQKEIQHEHCWFVILEDLLGSGAHLLIAMKNTFSQIKA